jgi:hypothetical protein
MSSKNWKTKLKKKYKQKKTKHVKYGQERAEERKKRKHENKQTSFQLLILPNTTRDSHLRTGLYGWARDPA